MDAFWQRYTELAAVVYPPLTPADGVEDSILVAAEARLGVLLPRRLRECYLLSGKRSDMHRSLDALLPPQELKSASEAIIFYVENQGVVVWGIRITDAHLEDPPVYVAANQSPLIWEPAWDQLTGFLHFMLLWQAMGGGTSHYGVAPINNSAILRAIEADWLQLEVPIGRNWNSMSFYRKERRVICVLGETAPAELLVAAKTQLDLDTVAQELGIEWLVYSGT